MHICAVRGCRATGRGRKGTRVHKFPEKNPSICRLWVAFVRATKPSFPGPKLGVVVCDKHFNESDYVSSDLRMAQLGLRSIKRVRLRPDAVPTKYPAACMLECSMEDGKTQGVEKTTRKPACDLSTPGSALLEPCLPVIEVGQLTPLDQIAIKSEPGTSSEEHPDTANGAYSQISQTDSGVSESVCDNSSVKSEPLTVSVKKIKTEADKFPTFPAMKKNVLVEAEKKLTIESIIEVKPVPRFIQLKSELDASSITTNGNSQNQALEDVPMSSDVDLDDRKMSLSLTPPDESVAVEIIPLPVCFSTHGFDMPGIPSPDS